MILLKLMQKKTRVTISIDKDIVNDIDKVRGIATRSAFLNTFLKRNLSFRTANEILRRDTD